MENNATNLNQPGTRPTWETYAPYATASTAYQIFNPDMTHWQYQNTCIGSKSAYGWTIVAGEPLGPLNERDAAVAAFERQHPYVAYFMAESHFVRHYATTHGHRVYLGSQPIWTPSDWQKAQAHASLRYQCRRAKNKGLHIKDITSTMYNQISELYTLRHQWLNTHGLPPMQFLVASDVFSQPGKRRFFCAYYDTTAVGLLVLAPVPQKNRYLTEVLIRHPTAPNGTMESLFDHLFTSSDWHTTQETWPLHSITMGLSPLRQSHRTHQNPWWIRLLFKLMREFGSPLYDFSGLNRFKEKCRPGAWEPLYLLSRNTITPKTLAAISKVFLQ